MLRALNNPSFSCKDVVLMTGQLRICLHTPGSNRHGHCHGSQLLTTMYHIRKVYWAHDHLDSLMAPEHLAMAKPERAACLLTGSAPVGAWTKLVSGWPVGSPAVSGRSLAQHWRGYRALQVWSSLDCCSFLNTCCISLQQCC